MARHPGRVARIVAVVLGLLLILIAMAPGLWVRFGREVSSHPFAQLTEGECVALVPADPEAVRSGGTVGTRTALAGASVEIVHQEVLCGDPGLSYTVGVVGPGRVMCPNDFYLDYFTTGIDNPENLPRELTACLVPNFTEGSCWAVDTNTYGYLETPCDEGARFRVDAVHGVDDPALCEPPARPMEFPLPARTYCLSEVR